MEVKLLSGALGAEIRGINLKFDMPKLKKDIESKTIAVLEKSFK